MISMITYINVYVPKLATSYMVSNYQCPLPLLWDKIRGCLPGLELEAEGPGRTSMLDGVGLATPICVESITINATNIEVHKELGSLD
jgi:hypothetical protein